MGLFTNIQYCDSSGNIQMGCEGCELIKGTDTPTCYANTLTTRYAGRNGWPDSFTTPKLFLERLQKIIKWPDLTGTSRPEKPWLNGLPRVVFLNDMGDTFTKGLPADWFAEVLPKLAASPHIFLVLTKWPHRFAEFSKRYTIPDNVWPGTSVTSDKTLFRIEHLMQVQARTRWVSVEPMWGPISFTERHGNVDWMVFGGESGPGAKPCDLQWIIKGISFCRRHDIAPFVKQLGAKVLFNGEPFLDAGKGHGDCYAGFPLKVAVREMPYTY